MDDEKQYIRQLLKDDPGLDKPEIAVEFARLLLSFGRNRDALLVIRTALEEGPRYDLYELRACSTHNALEELWVKAHEAAKIPLEKHGAEIYNEGLRTPDPDWREVLRQLKGT